MTDKTPDPMKICFFNLSPLYSIPGWYFKAIGCRHSVGPFMDLEDARDAARALASTCLTGGAGVTNNPFAGENMDGAAP